MTPALAVVVDAAGTLVPPPPFEGIAHGVRAIEALAIRDGWRRDDAAVAAAQAAHPRWASTRSAVVKALPAAIRTALQRFALWLYIFMPPSFTAEAARKEPGPSMAVLHAMNVDLEARDAYRRALVRARSPHTRARIGTAVVHVTLTILLSHRAVAAGHTHRRRRSGYERRWRRRHRPRRAPRRGPTLSGGGVRASAEVSPPPSPLPTRRRSRTTSMPWSVHPAPAAPHGPLLLTRVCAFAPRVS